MLLLRLDLDLCKPLKINYKFCDQTQQVLERELPLLQEQQEHMQQQFAGSQEEGGSDGAYGGGFRSRGGMVIRL
jgi:hypothetical protein